MRQPSAASVLFAAAHYKKTRVVQRFNENVLTIKHIRKKRKKTIQKNESEQFKINIWNDCGRDLD